MVRRARPGWVLLLVALPGCMQMPASTAAIPFSPFNSTSTTSAARPPDSRSAPPATVEAAMNVNRVGRKLLAANPAIGLTPSFITIGGETAAPELFHRGEAEVVITESLARKCNTESELAALLSRELGKMASERAGIGLVGVPESGPPPSVNIGHDYVGTSGPADITSRAELAYFEQKRAKAREAAAPPDPEVLARVYLQRAGFNPATLDTVAPLLSTADGNGKLEKLMSPVATK